MKKFATALAIGLFYSGHAHAQSQLPDGQYVSYMSGQCAAIELEKGGPISFKVAATCQEQDMAAPAVIVPKKSLKVKGNKLTLGAAKLQVVSYDNGLIRGRWTFQGQTYDVVFIRQDGK